MWFLQLSLEPPSHTKVGARNPVGLREGPSLKDSSLNSLHLTLQTKVSEIADGSAKVAANDSLGRQRCYIVDDDFRSY